MNFLKFNNLSFFSKLFFLLYDKKKNKRSHNQVQLKKQKKHPAKLMNRGKQGYFAKLVNRVVDFTKFNNLVFFKIIFYLTIFFFKK
jgi:hypothetical protein